MASQTHVNDLPDDMLVEILGFLYTEQLLLTRAVCRRWRDLALHSDLWRHRSLHGKERAAKTVMRLAPCLRSLTVWYNRAISIQVKPSPDEEVRRRQALDDDTQEASRCGVAELRLTVPDCTSLPRAVRFLRKQGQQLRRLRRLHLHLRFFVPGDPAGGSVSDTDVAPTGWEDLCRLLYEGVGGVLEELELISGGCISGTLDLTAVYGLPTVPEELMMEANATRSIGNNGNRACLRKLTAGSDGGVDALVPLLLARHAPSMVVLDLLGSVKVPAFLAAGCANLRELSCNVTGGGLQVLMHCRGLESLTLRFSAGLDTATYDSAAALLRSALQLRVVALLLGRIDPFGRRERVLAALGATRDRSALRTLRVHLFAETTALGSSLFGSLATVLPSLPNLTELELKTRGNPPISFLEGITPETAPSLQLLRCRDPLRSHRVEGYTPALRRLLARMPGLHVSFQGLRCFRKLGHFPASPSTGSLALGPLDWGPGPGPGHGLFPDPGLFPSSGDCLCTYSFPEEVEALLQEQLSWRLPDWTEMPAKSFGLFTHDTLQQCHLHGSRDGEGAIAWLWLSATDLEQKTLMLPR